jgi:hypothetical protein
VCVCAGRFACVRCGAFTVRVRCASTCTDTRLYFRACACACVCVRVRACACVCGARGACVCVRCVRVRARARQLLVELHVVPPGRVVRITGAALQDDGVKGLEKILEAFDEPGTAPLREGDRVEAKRNGEWGHYGTITHLDSSTDSRAQWRGTYDVHFGSMRTFELSDGSSVTRRDHDFDIGVRRKDLRAADDRGGVLIIDDAHQLEPGTEKGARQVGKHARHTRRRSRRSVTSPGP